jgi:hypothetical protein
MIRPRLLVSTVLFAIATAAPFFACGPGRPPAPPSAGPALAVRLTPAEAKEAWAHAESVFETRCVVCHGCYDAPCQLKLTAFEGIDRGGTEKKVYESGRLSEAEPTRLFIDARDAPAWRRKGFHAVLPEGTHADPRASVLLRMLDLKNSHPLLPETDIEKDFTLDLDRKETCPDAEHFDAYASAHPLWGMPYALPALDPSEHRALVDWVEAGAPHVDAAPLAKGLAASVEEWETFLNGETLKAQLAARYVYEHLFLGSLYFKGLDEQTFFRLVRSRTPVGPVDEIATRRPFEDPKTDRVYYRLVRREERPLAKTQMPYALGPARLARYRKLLIEPDYVVDRLPTYEPAIASNPFRAFAAIPVKSRYRFMLDEAEFTMMGFIKGPVCRGQVALNVIQERFWIGFVDPDAPWISEEASLLASEATDLALPAQGGSNAAPTQWLGYGRAHDRYVQKKNALLEDAARRKGGLSLSTLWSGDGNNPNAALTVFRHFDSATVTQGFVGGPPKTAWLVDYSILERIHYLLVAGFDVFGNVTHQVTTRLYMDFLRMESEANFLALLPAPRRRELTDAWYRGLNGEGKARVDRELTSLRAEPDIQYRSARPEEELDVMWQGRLGLLAASGYALDGIDTALRPALERLAKVAGAAASALPEISFVTVRSGQDETYFTILRDSAHTNVSHLFDERARRVTAEDSLAIVRGFLGAYPNALFEVSRGDLEAFVDAVAHLDGEPSARALRRRFGVLRASDRFWSHSDQIQAAYRRQAPAESGLFDYNHLDGQ